MSKKTERAAVPADAGKGAEGHGGNKSGVRVLPATQLPTESELFEAIRRWADCRDYWLRWAPMGECRYGAATEKLRAMVASLYRAPRRRAQALRPPEWGPICTCGHHRIAHRGGENTEHCMAYRPDAFMQPVACPCKQFREEDRVFLGATEE